MIDSQNLRFSSRRRASRSTRRLRFALLSLALVVAAGGGTLVASIPQAGLDRAIAAQRTLVAERPTDAALREDLGSLLALAGDLAGAEEAFRETIALDPANANPHFQLGGVLERLGKEGKALDEYKAAVELDPKHAWAYYEAGTIWMRRGLDSKAKKAYAKALALDPTLADPQVNPHILENRLATSSMILSYREYLPETSAPATFHEPARIAGLILEKPQTGDRLASEPAPEQPAAATQGGGYARVTGGERGAETTASGDGGESVASGDEAAKTISNRDLDTSNKSGQVVNGTGVGTVGGRKSASETAADRARAREAARQAARPARPAAGGVVYPQNPGYPPQPTKPAFEPSPDSSGRIEVRLDERAG